MATEDDLLPEVEDDENTMEIDLGEETEEEGVTRNEDGSTTLALEDMTFGDENPEFYSNLAEKGIDSIEVAKIVTELLDRTDEDKETHKSRIEQYADAIRRLGLDGNPQGGQAAFEGASKAVSPMMIEAAVDFQASAIRELMPEGGEEGGPVKHKVIGKPTQTKFDRAVRKARHMNWQLTEQMPSFRDTMEVLLTQTAMSGRQYLKIYQNRTKNRPEEMFVPMSDIWLPASAVSFVSANRKTHAQKLDKQEMQNRIDSGMYLPINLESPPEAPEKSAAEQASDKAAGKTESQPSNEDGLRLVREIYVILSIQSDPETQGAPAPYIVTIDDNNREVLSIYRDWDPEDPNREALEHIIEFPFVNWDGSPIGLPQLIGGLSISATGALNALLDSAHLNNLSGAVALKGKTGKGGQNVSVNPGEINVIDAPVAVDDIRKLVMPLPFNQPSPVLFQLLGFLTEAGKGVTNVALEKIAEAKGDMPVGTTLALIEQGAKVYASIHARLHRAMKRVLKALHQLNKQYLDERSLAREAGEVLARRADYEGPFDVVPVSDPNIFSETQRFAQIQAVAARAMGNPLYDQRKVEELILKRLKLPDGVDLLVPKPEPKKLNPINENAAAAMGQPIIAFPDQDHMAHLRAHMEFLQNPMYGMNPLLQPILLPILLPHIKDHLVYAYVTQVVEAASKAAEMSITDLMDDDDEVSNLMDDLLAEASTQFLNRAITGFDDTLAPPVAPVMPGQDPAQAQPQSEFLQVLGQLNQLMQQFMPPQPMDPEIAKSEAIKQKAASDQTKAQTETQKIQLKQQELAQKDQENQTKRLTEERLQTRAIEADMEQTSQNNQTKILTNVQDNQTALTIAGAEIEAGKHSALSTGGGIDPGNV